MKKYMMIHCVVLQSMMVSAMDIRQNDMMQVKKMEIFRNIRALQKRVSMESMEDSTSEAMSLERSTSGSLSASSSGSFSIKKQLSNYSISGLVGSPPTREPSQFLQG
jgi:hypothetical protein